MGLIDHLRPALADRYRIEDEIGSGGMATVFRARDLKHDRTVAIKVLKEELAQSVGAERFLQEIRIVAKLQHPHILSLLDSGEVDGTLYHVMPFVEGESLRKKLERESELPIPETLRILGEVADALAFAHQHGVVHRDIKPDNILMAGRHAVVADFGVSKAIDAAMGPARVTTTGVAIGTPAYMAPEQAVGSGTVDHRADLYALGIVGYEMLTGHPPFQGRTPQQILGAKLAGQVPTVTQLRPAVPEAVSHVLMRCLEERPADRWQTAGELRDQLELVRTSSGETTPWSVAPAKAARGRSWKTMTGVVLGAVVLGVAAWILGHRGPPSARNRSSEEEALAAESATSAGRMVVTPYKNLTGDPSLDPFGRQVAAVVERDLTQAAVAQVVPLPTAANDGQNAAATQTDPAALARDLRVELVVTGEYYLRGDSVEMVSRILKPAAGKVLFNLPGARGRRQAPDQAMATVAQQVAGAAAVLSWQDPTGAQPNLWSPPPDLQAFRLFMEAEQALQRRDRDGSLPSFQRLRDLYPDWLRPPLGQMQALNGGGRLDQADSVGRYLDARRDRLTRLEAAQLDYNLAFNRYDWEAAYRAGHEMSQVMGLPYRDYRVSSRTNRLQEIVDYLATRDTSEWLDGNEVFYFSALVRLGRYEDALTVARLIRNAGRGGGFYLEARVLAAMGRRSEVDELVAQTRAHPNTNPASLTNLLGEAVRVASGVGRMEDARYYAALALKEAEAAPPDSTLWDRAYILAYIERWDEAAAMMKELVAEAPNDLSLFEDYGWVLAMGGRRSEAEAIRDRLEAWPGSAPRDARLVWAGKAMISGALGERDRAFSEIRQAIDTGWDFDTWTVWNPMFRWLHDDPRFETLITPR